MTRNAQMSADIGPVLFHPRVPVSSHISLSPYSRHYSLQAGMRSYFNGATPPPASAGPGRPHPVTSGRLVTGRASSSSLPRSPDQDNSLLTSGLGTGSGSGQSGHGSLGSHSSHEVSYMNIYQNTNIPHIYVSH